MKEEYISQEFRLKKIDKQRNCFIKEINQNELRSKKHKLCRVLTYFDIFFILASAVTRWISISAFPSLVSVAIGITSFAV